MSSLKCTYSGLPSNLLDTREILGLALWESRILPLAGA